MQKEKTQENDNFEIAKPHTIKKFDLIERYVDEWARKILGFNGSHGYERSRGIIYIDCMSSSGMYKDVDNHFVEGTALRVARQINRIIPGYPDKNAILIFNDIDESKVQRLEERINEENLTNIQVSYFHEDCNDFLRGLNLDEFKKHYNTLLLYDPYIAAIDWDAVTPFLNQWGEVIINHMVHDTSRGAVQAKNPEVIKRYQETYQSDIASIIDIESKDELNEIVLNIINNLRDKDKPKMYIASFPFFNRKNGHVYNLIHCTQNINGTKLFKKVAWKTFGDKSSLKDTHGYEKQMMLDFDGGPLCTSPTDEHCYYVWDIVRYVYDKYHNCGTVKIDAIYDDLDAHPIFPSDGYKNEIKAGLRDLGVKFRKNREAEFPSQ